MARTAQYKHQFLDRTKEQIRLVMIARARSDEPLDLHIQTFDLEYAPSYSALSYVWGSAVPTCKIGVDGMWLNIRKNLYHFLKEFRQEPGRPQWLWIDQISIDQTNLQERNHQVRFMSSIYSQAASVTVWLNDERGICANAARDFVSFQDPAGLADLLRNEYFSRLWVVQEVLLARHVRFLTPGNLWVSWDAIQETVERTDASFFKKVDLGTSSAMSLLDLSGERLATSLDWCILNFSSNKCEDPRDKVYGFMGLIDPSYRFDVDYSRPKLEVYRDAVHYSRWENRPEVARVLGQNMEIDPHEVAKYAKPAEQVEFLLPPTRSPLQEDIDVNFPGSSTPRRSLVLEPRLRTPQSPPGGVQVDDNDIELLSIPTPRRGSQLESIASVTRKDSFVTQQEKVRRKFVHRKGAVSTGDGSLHGTLASLAHKTWRGLGLNNRPAIDTG